MVVCQLWAQQEVGLAIDSKVGSDFLMIEHLHVAGSVDSQGLCKGKDSTKLV